MTNTLPGPGPTAGIRPAVALIGLSTVIVGLIAGAVVAVVARRRQMHAAA